MLRASGTEDPYAFRFEPQAYHVLSEGGGVESARFPWDAALMRDLGELAAGAWREVGVARIAEVLRSFLEEAGWRTREQAIEAACREGREVTVTITANAAELYALPWELLGVGASGLHLGALPGVAVRYTWPDVQVTPPTPAQRAEGGRILLAWSAAGGAVPALDHQRAIARAAAAGHHPDVDPVVDLPGVTLARLRAALREAVREGRPFAALHLLCHGADEDGASGLVFDSDDGDGVAFVDGGRLRRVLAPYASGLRLVVLAACRGAGAGEIAGQLGSVAQALHRAGIEAVVAARAPLSVSGSTVITARLYRGLLVELDSLERALGRAREAVADAVESPDWAALQLYASGDGDGLRPVIYRPYRGLLTFHSEHRRLLFGREREIAEICGELVGLRERGAPRLLVVQGASGTGKSSTVLGGVVPDLVAAADGDFTWLRMRPGAGPFAALAAALSDTIGAAVEADAATIEEVLADQTGPVLIVVDQLEELFTLVADAGERAAFARLLWHLARAPAGPVSVIMTLRIDFLGRCGEVVLEPASDLRLDRIAYADDHRVTIPQMARAQLREAIEGPARAVGLALEGGLVERILGDVRGEPGALPAISYVLDLLWAARADGLLTQADYDALGGVAGALYGRAEALLEAMSAAELGQARRLLVQLVGIREDAAVDTRRRLPMTSLRPATDADPEALAAFERVLARLVDARLLVRDDDATAGATVEVAHEALIRRWERLRRWVAEDRERLASLARVEGWVAEWRNAGYLLHDSRLGYAEDVAARFPGDLSAEARVMLRDSRAAVDARRAELERLLAEAERQRAIAQRRLDSAIAIADGIVRTIDGELAKIAGAAAVRKVLLERTAAFQEGLIEGASESLEALRSRLDSHVNRGELACSHDDAEVASRELRAAVALADRLLESIGSGGPDYEIAASAARAYATLAGFEVARGALDVARSLVEQACILLRPFTASEPDAERGVAMLWALRGRIADGAGDLVGAQAAFDVAFRWAQEAAAASPDVLRYRHDLALAHDWLATIAEKRGDRAHADAHFRRAAVLAEELCAADPTSVEFRVLSFTSAERLAFVSGREDLAAGEGFARQAHAAALALLEADPDNLLHRHRLAMSHNILARAITDDARDDERREHLRRFLELAAANAALDPSNLDLRLDHFIALEALGTLYLAKGPRQEGEALVRSAVERGQALLGEGPNPAVTDTLIVALGALTSAIWQRGEILEARDHAAQVVELARSRVADDPGAPMLRGRLFQALVESLTLAASCGEIAASRLLYAEILAQAAALDAVAVDWDRSNLALTHQNMAVLERSRGDAAAAQTCQRRGVEVLVALDDAEATALHGHIRTLLTTAQGLAGDPSEREALRGDLGRLLGLLTRLRRSDDAPSLAWDEAVCASTLGVITDELDQAAAYYERAHALVTALTAANPTASALLSLFSIKGNLLWCADQRGDHEGVQRLHRARLGIFAQLERGGLDPQVLGALRQQLDV